MTPGAENPDATPPTLELIPKDSTKDPGASPLDLNDLRLTPFNAKLYLLNKVKLNQDGSTGFYDWRVEADGLEGFSSPIYYINDSELVRGRLPFVNLVTILQYFIGVPLSERKYERSVESIEAVIRPWICLLVLFWHQNLARANWK